MMAHCLQFFSRFVAVSFAHFNCGYCCVICRGPRLFSRNHCFLTSFMLILPAPTVTHTHTKKKTFLGYFIRCNRTSSTSVSIYVSEQIQKHAEISYKLFSASIFRFSVIFCFDNKADLCGNTMIIVIQFFDHFSTKKKTQREK